MSGRRDSTGPFGPVIPNGPSYPPQLTARSAAEARPPTRRHRPSPAWDRLTSPHLGCAWLGRQLLQRALSSLGRSQERRRIAVAGRAYTLPVSRRNLTREASFSVRPGLSDRKAPEL